MWDAIEFAANKFCRATRKLVLLKYCTQPIFCGMDAITDNNFYLNILVLKVSSKYNVSQGLVIK